MRGGAIGLAAAILAVPLAARAAAPVAPRAASREPGRVDQKAACLTCHDDLAAQIARPVAHPPARQGNCTACHNPHVSRFDRLLKERPGVVCLGCHAAVGQELARAVVHPPAAEGRCAACHEPHGGTNPRLLVKPGPELCGTCHASVALWTKRPVQHPPFAKGQCGVCHESHGSGEPGLVRKPAGVLCGACHAPGPAFKAAHKGYPVERAACQQCHDPHSSARPGLFRENLHPPFQQGTCTVCHALPGSVEPFRAKTALADLCGGCHRPEAAATRERPLPHLGGSMDCVSCHNPHTADGKALLKKPLPDLCLGCHDPGGSRGGGEGRFVTHGKDLSCPTCHDPHGGNRPLLLAADPIELCARCHTPQHTVSHPMGETSRDPRNRTPMNCLSCHAMHDAPYPKYLVRSGDRDLCVSCHTNLAGSR